MDERIQPSPRHLTRHAIFGDVGGHLAEFLTGLASVGVDARSMTIPADLVIVQVGDIVHKGPHSDLVVAFVDAMIRNNPGQWVQLAGNHEIQYLVGTPPFIRETIAPESAKTLRRLHEEGLIRASYAFTSVSGDDYLITHAGLTQPNHARFGAQDAHATSAALNASDWADLVEPGIMLWGVANPNAGIFWAESANEVYQSWHDHGSAAPFHQIHGHSTLRVWKRFGGLLRDNYGEWLTFSMANDFERMHTTWTHFDKRYHGIDNKFEQVPHREDVAPLVIA